MTGEQPLTDLQRRVLLALLASGEPMTGNQLGHACGFPMGGGSDRFARDGRRMGAANRVIGPLIGLRKRGLVRFASRLDGLTGSADVLTAEGERVARELRAGG